MRQNIRTALMKFLRERNHEGTDNEPGILSVLVNLVDTARERPDMMNARLQSDREREIVEFIMSH